MRPRPSSMRFAAAIAPRTTARALTPIARSNVSAVSSVIGAWTGSTAQGKKGDTAAPEPPPAPARAADERCAPAADPAAEPAGRLVDEALRVGADVAADQHGAAAERLDL